MALAGALLSFNKGCTSASSLIIILSSDISDIVLSSVSCIVTKLFSNKIFVNISIF